MRKSLFTQIFIKKNIALSSFNTLPSFEEISYINFSNKEFPTELNHFEYEDYKISSSPDTNSYTFTKCSVSVINITIENCTAFSQNSLSSGGSISLIYSSLRVIESKFNDNYASLGGVICSYSSSIICDKSTFQNNKAFKFGGAIYLQVPASKSNSNLYYSYFTSTKFRNNLASNFGGSVAISCIPFVYFSECLFESSTAGISGGALFSSNSIIHIFSSNFTSNSVDQQIHNSTNYKPDFSLKSSTNIYAGRGGGAIWFSNGKDPTNNARDTENTYVLYTQNCSFTENKAINSTYGRCTRSEFSQSTSIFLRGDYVQWQSFYDDLDFEPQNNKSYLVQPKTLSMTFHYIPSIEYSSNSSSTTNGTSYIPSPTTFVYQATPVTQLPFPTKIISKTTQHFSTPSIRTVHKTPFNTPESTPYTTPFNSPELTPYQTPFNTPELTPYKTPFNTPEKTPFESPYITPHISPFKTPDMTTVTPTQSSSANEALDGSTNDDEKGTNVSLIIGIVVAIVVVVIIAIVGFIIYWRKKKNDDSSSGTFEEFTDTAPSTRTSTVSITHANPLYNSLVVEDDLFKNDFDDNNVQVSNF